MKLSEQTQLLIDILEIGHSGMHDGWKEIPIGVAKLEAAIEACRLYLKTGTPFALKALEKKLEELGDDSMGR